jgi:rubredoxin
MLEGAISGPAVEQPTLLCPDCGRQMRRLTRRGFLQTDVFPRFGYYPWECPMCRRRRFYRVRGKRQRKSRLDEFPA